MQQHHKLIIALAGIAALGLAGVVGSLISTAQGPDCQQRSWAPSDFFSFSKPQASCPIDTELRNASVKQYLQTHINDLAPTPAVLGGRFMVTEVFLLSDGSATIAYEDGHIALVARCFPQYEQQVLRGATCTELSGDVDRVGNLIRNNPGLPADQWYLEYDSPGHAGELLPLIFNDTTTISSTSSTAVSTDALRQGMRVHVLGTTQASAALVQYMKVIGE